MAVNEDISYNAIIGRTMLKEMRVITSIYNLAIKLPTLNGIRCLQGCKSDSSECYTSALHTAKQTYKHVLLADGGPQLDSCYKYVKKMTDKWDKKVQHPCAI